MFSLICVSLLLASAQVGAEDIPWVWHSSDAPSSASSLAVLLDHIRLSGDAIEVRQRMKALVVATGVRVTPVVHVQVDTAHLPRLGAAQTQVIHDAVLAAGRRSTSNWVQLDFEALQSQQSYYLALLRLLRRDLPPTVKLSVTILASWCEQKSLMVQLSADEVVPMFFRMGSNASAYLERLRYHSEQFSPRCQDAAAGFAMQEAPALSVQERYARRYWFNYKNWRVSPPYAG